MSVLALVPVAGRADSQGGGASAALAIVAGASLLSHAIHRLLASGVVDRVLVLGDASLAAELPADDRVSLAPGPLSDAPDAAVRLVHDPLRAFAPPDLVARVVAEVVATGSPVVPALPCSDTVKRLDPSGVVLDTPDRAGLRVAQTPIGFPAGVVPTETPPVGARVIPGDPAARRLASPVELAVARGGAR